ncbi:hypothetical protein DEM27_01540 [Metarhizobium album]|uniref:Uncharacterized protein n=1 Tax=Metarhizobium album TaxID=2182425 RepID=A0A2U2DX56_9HYPH|nr:hypothetical protein [Rhizobium album]PWE57903.1 hypothetical protein DEM27_01540 [Rhizobium album]
MMTEIDPKLADAAWRNGRDCADVAFLHQPPPWSDEHAEKIFEQMASALISSFPGGHSAFAPNAELIAKNAREGFDERLRELMAGPSVEGSQRSS